MTMDIGFIFDGSKNTQLDTILMRTIIIVMKI